MNRFILQGCILINSAHYLRQLREIERKQELVGLVVLLEGMLVDVSRHSKCDAKGMEIEPNFSDTKKVNTGNLIILFKDILLIDRLTEVQLENLVTKEDLVNVTGKNCPSGTYTFWHPEGEIDKIELETGQDIRLKTKGNGQFKSIFIFSLAKVDGGTVTECNLAGDEKAGASWTDKIMANKSDVSNGMEDSPIGIIVLMSTLLCIK
uniref:Arpin n=1 Tax=Oncorhynchus mykiss TaxID=8022 RepID=A0A8C7S111_ONCMY